MSDLQVTNAFADGDTVSATNFNTNYSDIVTYINNRNSAAATWDAMYCTHATNVPLTANNSAGTQDIARFQDNGTTVFSVNDGGYINAPYNIYARAYKSADQAISTINPFKITFDVVSQNGGGMDSTGKFTAPFNGKYFVSCAIDWPSRTSAASYAVLPTLYIYKNGAVFTETSLVSHTADDISLYLRDVMALSVNDYIEIYADSGGNSGSPVIPSGSNRTVFNVVKIA